MKRLILLFALVSHCALLAGCSREEVPPPGPTMPAQVTQPVPHTGKPATPPEAELSPPVPMTQPGPKIALTEPVVINTVELSPEALAVWRQYAEQKPTLLLFSAQPMLVPPPPDLVATVDAFASSAPPGELARRSYPKNPDVLLMPDMTLDIALRRNWFGRVAWALPFHNPEQPLPVDAIRKQLRDGGVISAAEAATIQGSTERIQGVLRSTPVEMATLDKLGAFTGPVVIHIDQSYFKNLYKNDIATPLLNLVFETLTKLRERKAPVLAVTFCHGNLDERIALDVRFVGEVVARLFAQPHMFEQPVPVNWERQGQILTLYNLFQKEKARELALAQEQDLPKSAWVKFNLYQSAAAHKEGDRALDYLARTVRLDKTYAMEYLTLADMAYESKRPDEALRMLKLARAVFPDNPEIQLRIARLSAELGDRQAALRMVRQLQALPWSPVYQAPLPDYLKGFAEFLQKEPPPAPPATAPAESNQSEQTKPSGRLPMGHPATMPPGHP